MCVPPACDLIAFGVWWFVLEVECVLRAGLLLDARERGVGCGDVDLRCEGGGRRGDGDGVRWLVFDTELVVGVPFSSESFEVEFKFELELDCTADCDCDSSIVSNPQKVYRPLFLFLFFVFAFREFNSIQFYPAK